MNRRTLLALFGALVVAPGPAWAAPPGQGIAAWHVAVELAFGEGTPYAARYPSLYGLSFDQNLAITQEVMSKIVATAANEAGVAVVREQYSAGGVFDAINPTSGIVVRGDRARLAAFADIVGFLAQQGSVFAFERLAPETPGQTLGVMLVDRGDNRLLDRAVAERVWTAVRNELLTIQAAEGDAAVALLTGFTPGYTDDGRAFLLSVGLDGRWTPAQTERLVVALTKVSAEIGIPFEPVVSVYLFEPRSNDWTSAEGAGGRAYLTRLTTSLGFDKASRILGLVPMVDGWIDAAYAQYAPFR